MVAIPQTRFYYQPKIRFTRITDIQHSTTDKGQKFQADLADIQYLKPRAGVSKLREVKKKLTKLKARDASQRIKKMLALVEESMNNTNIGYLGISPMEIEREPASIGKDSVKKLYIGKKLTKHKERISRYVKKKDKNIKNLKPLQVGNLVWIASGRVQKKRYRGALDKPTSDKKPNSLRSDVHYTLRNRFMFLWSVWFMLICFEAISKGWCNSMSIVTE